MKSLKNSSFSHLSRRGSALMVNLLIVLLITTIAVFLLEKLIPVSRIVATLQESNIAYYNALSAKELALFRLDPKNPGDEEDWQTVDYGDTVLQSKSEYRITARGTELPIPGQGTSDYDHDWNTLDTISGIQLLIDNTSVDWDNTKLQLRTPDVQHDENRPILKGESNGIVSWRIAGATRFITAGTDADQIISATTINDIGQVMVGDLEGINNTTDMNVKISDEYGSLGCDVSPFCMFKFFTVRPLLTGSDSDPTPLPYIEWRIEGLGSDIPLPEAIIETRGQFRGYLRTMTFHETQLTTAGLTNFTVYQ